MDVINRRCAGLDVHKKEVTVCIRLMDDDGRVRSIVRTYETMTGDLRDAAEWMRSEGVTIVAMESTGVYWKPIWNLLEGQFDLLLCNARHVKNVPGRKTDVQDAAWLARLLQHGLLSGSFVPCRGQRNLRDLTRLRAKLSEENTRYANRIQKILEDTNVKFASVASDPLGKSGRAMLRALIRGETDPAAMADLALGQLRKKIPALRRALEGNVTEHHRFLLDFLLRKFEEGEAAVEELDQRVALVMAELDGGGEEPDPPPGGETPVAAAPAEPAPPQELPPRESGPPPYQDAVQILLTIPGVGVRTAENILAEIGTDMTRFASHNHLASWAGMAPGNNESAGKRKSGKTTKGSAALRRALNQAAWSASRTKNTYLRARYRRIAARRGRKRAIVALGHTILTMAYHMLSRQCGYRELGGDYFDRLDEQRTVRRLVQRLEALGHEVTLTREDDRDAA